jgi:hypothetical protein
MFQQNGRSFISLVPCLSDINRATWYVIQVFFTSSLTKCMRGTVLLVLQYCTLINHMNETDADRDGRARAPMKRPGVYVRTYLQLEER